MMRFVTAVALALGITTGTSTAVSIDTVYFGQTHVLKPDNPYFGLVSDRDALIKAHVVDPASPASPAVTAVLTLGGQTLNLPLTGPANLPASIPDGLGVVQHSYADSFTAMIPAAWVQPGLEVTVTASGDSVDFNNLNIGAPSKVIMRMFDVQYFSDTNDDYDAGTFNELEAKWPVAELEVRRLRHVVFPELVIPPRAGVAAARVTSKADYLAQTGITFDGEQAAALAWNGALKRAGGRSGRIYLSYINIYGVDAGGQAGGFSGVGSGTRHGVLHHELGHALSLPHWGDNGSYPYKGYMHGISAPAIYNDTHAGPAWAFDLRSEAFIPPTVQPNNVGEKPIGTYKCDPMQGGGTGFQEPGYLMNHFSDYSMNQMRNYLEGHVLIWNESLGSYASWNQGNADYTNMVSNNGVQYPIELDAEVITVMASVSGAKPDVCMVYPPIGPYTGGLIKLFDPTSPADRAEARAIFAPTNGCDVSLRILQGGVEKTYMLAASWEPTVDPLSGGSLKTEAVNLPASDGVVTRAELLYTPDAEVNGLPAGPQVLYTWPASPDTTPPAISGLSPANNATDVATGAELVITFNEAIAAGTGDITLKNLTDETESTIEVTDGSQISINGAFLTINPTAVLEGVKNYAIWIDPTAIKDLSDNTFGGIADDTIWNFTTAAPDTTTPTLDSFLNNKPGGQIYDNDSVIYTLTFSEAMTASTIETGDFSNNGTAGINVDSVTPISDSVYEVVVSPTSTGTLQLQVSALANLEDLVGNDLDTNSAIQDPAVIDVLAFVANAASLVLDFQETVASENFDEVDNTWGGTEPGRYWHISVNSNNVGYAAYIALDSSGDVIPPYIRSFSNPVIGWSFIGGGTNGDLTISEESGGIVSWTTTDETDPITNTFDSFGMDQKKFWNATDPGTGFNLPADEAAEAATTHDKNVTGYRSFGQATATIDISGLASGKVIFFYGAFSATPQVNAILRDSSGLKPDIVLADLHSNGDVAQRTEYYAAEVDFDTDGGIYDTIVYNYLQPGSEPDGSGNGRSGGLVVLGPEPVATNPFGDWAATGTLGAVTFDGDTNGDGVQDGMAFLLGAANPDDNALGLLPTVTETGGGLVLTFSCLNDASNGDATLNVEHSSDLGISDAWTAAAVPEASGATSGVTFVVSPGSPTNDVTATIDSGEAASGKLFGRLRGENP